MLTGGFGHHLGVASAMRIGLLPPIDYDRFGTVSNGVGPGALLVLRQADTIEHMIGFQRAVEYIELSGHPFFQDSYIEHITFPEWEEKSAVTSTQGGEH